MEGKLFGSLVNLVKESTKDNSLLTPQEIIQILDCFSGLAQQGVLPVERHASFFISLLTSSHNDIHNDYHNSDIDVHAAVWSLLSIMMSMGVSLAFQNEKHAMISKLQSEAKAMLSSLLQCSGASGIAVEMYIHTPQITCTQSHLHTMCKN